MFGRALLVAVLAAAVLVAPADASSVKLKRTWNGSEGLSVWINIDAEAGEANRVKVTWSKLLGRLKIEDAGTFLLKAPAQDAERCLRLTLQSVACELDVSANLTVVVQLGDGDDQVVIGNPEAPPLMFDAAQLLGGPGNDVLDSGAHRSYFEWEPGSDLMVAKGHDYTYFSYFSAPGPVAVSFDGRANDGIAGERDNVSAIRRTLLSGSQFDDVLRGSGIAESLSGNAGNDEVYGGGGDDVLHGGPGVDRLYGEAGNDLVQGGFDWATRDELFCGDGLDRGRADSADVTTDCETIEPASEFGE